MLSVCWLHLVVSIPQSGKPLFSLEDWRWSGSWQKHQRKGCPFFISGRISDFLKKEGKMPWSKDNNQVGNNQVGIGSKTQLLPLDDWMIVLRQFGETWSNWPKEVKHDTLVTHLDREQERESTSHIDDFRFEDSKSPKLAELEKTLRWPYRLLNLSFK